jgi:hypothetical protein
MVEWRDSGGVKRWRREERMWSTTDLTAWAVLLVARNCVLGGKNRLAKNGF